jgi:hypothetical protein
MLVTAPMVMIIVSPAPIVVVIAGPVPWVVFFRANEINRPITRIVLSAMLAPISGMPRRHVQVDRRRRRWLRLDQHRLRIDERRGPFISNLHLPVHSRGHFAGQHDMNIKVARMAGTGSRKQEHTD